MAMKNKFQVGSIIRLNEKHYGPERSKNTVLLIIDVSDNIIAFSGHEQEGLAVTAVWLFDNYYRENRNHWHAKYLRASDIWFKRYTEII